MQYTGKIHTLNESQLATFTAEKTNGVLLVEVEVGGQTVIRFPLSENASSEELQCRLRNICNQTGLIINTCRVEVENTP